MNSISLVPLSSNRYLILYADDILLVKPIVDKSDFHRDLQAISDWILHHGLHLNHTKTQFLPISRSRNQPIPSITLNVNIIPSCTSVKYLGVTISHNLTWSHHIGDICRTTKRQLGKVHKQFLHALCHLRNKIYRTAILPRLKYCCVVWDPHHLKDKQALENVQKFGGRVITQRWSNDYNSLCTSLNLKLLSTRRHIQKFKLCYKIVNNLMHPCQYSHPLSSSVTPTSLLKTSSHAFCVNHHSQIILFYRYHSPLELTSK